MEIILFEIAVIIMLVLLNGIFSMSELALVSARKVRLRQAADRGSLGAQTALELAENPRDFLSTMQIGITLVGILAGAFGGATIAEILAEQVSAIELLSPYSEAVSVALVVVAITYVSIVLGELIPKSIALNAPETIAIALSRPVRALSRLSLPAVWLLSKPTSAVIRLFGLHAKVEPPVTDEEIKDLISVGAKAGVFEEAEQDLMERVFDLEARRVTSLMTPRINIEWLDINRPQPDIERELQITRFSRLPVANGTLDNILGYVTAKSLLRIILSNKRIDIRSILQTPLYVPESATVLDLLGQFRLAKTHLAIVVDEFGGVEGIITLHDLLEVIIGELANSPHRPAESRVHTIEGGTKVLDGRLSIMEFKDELGIRDLPDDEADSYQTLGGFVLTRIGHLPEVGENFLWDRYEFSIVEMDRHRVSKVAARALPDGRPDRDDEEK